MKPVSIPSDRIVRKLESVFKLSDAERDAVFSLPVQEVDLQPDQDVVREGDRPSRCFVVLEGITCTYKVVSDGKRQIHAFHIPGDIPDLQSLHLKVLDNSVCTLTPCKVGFIRHEELRRISAAHPRIADALWRETLIDAAIFREWMTSIGRRDAYSRIAHVMCELVVKFRAVGLSDGDTIPFPITQGEIGDALGLSNVHVNRSVMQLRADGLIALQHSTLTVLDWDGLQQAGDFDPTYLHLEQPESSRPTGRSAVSIRPATECARS